jgi:transcriptional regulator with XRE-family HTH domain
VTQDRITPEEAGRRRARRLALGVSQEALAKLIGPVGISFSTLNRWETLKTSPDRNHAVLWDQALARLERSNRAS